MRIRWFGQSAFLLSGEAVVFVDPFGDLGREQFRYPPVQADADVLLVTHEHGDHNGVEQIGGDPVVIRSRSGRHESPIGEVVGIASEHDDVAGTQRGPNTIFCFTVDGVRFCHLGDFGQPALRPEQLAAIGDDVDVLFVPAGDGPTIGGEPAAQLVRDVAPRLVIPMHYRTEHIDFLDPPDAFFDALGLAVEERGGEVELDEFLGTRAKPRLLKLTLT